ncbi:hypothetical protein NLX62_06820, partial [Mycobacteriaceae bacterium Msp059]|nr:hypothetical protein [Mycobacteriaceae bacterium Msp059]
LTTAASWSDEAAGLIGQVKETIRGTIKTALDVIDDTLEAANGKNTDSAIGKIQDHANEWNKAAVQWGADRASGKEGVPDEPPAPKKGDFEKARDESAEEGAEPGDDPDLKDSPILAFSNASFNSTEKGAKPPVLPAEEQPSVPAADTDSALYNATEKGATPPVLPAEDQPAVPAANAGATPFDSTRKGGPPTVVPVVQPPSAPTNPGRTPATPAASAPTPSGG